MVSPLDSESVRRTSVFASTANSGTAGFDPRKQAEEATAQKKSEFDRTLAEIQAKGFRAWAKDASLQALKEKMRQQAKVQGDDGDIDTEKLSEVIRRMMEKQVESTATASTTVNTAAQGDSSDVTFAQGLVVPESRPRDNGDSVGFFIPSMI